MKLVAAVQLFALVMDQPRVKQSQTPAIVRGCAAIGMNNRPAKDSVCQSAWNPPQPAARRNPIRTGAYCENH